MGSERSSVGKAVCPPPTAPSFFSRKRKQKGISCRGSGWGEQPAGCQQLEEGPRHCSPWCCCLIWGLVGGPLGVWQTGGQRPFHATAFGTFGREQRALLSRVPAGQSNHLTKPSAPCLVPARGNAASCRFSPPFPVLFAAPSCGHSWKLIRVKIAVGHV